MTRGYMLISCATHLQRRYDEAARKAILARLPDDTRNLLDRVNKVEWYPRIHAKSLFTAIAKHHIEGDGKAREALLDVGRSIADMATNTFLRLLMKLMTPALFARKVPDFWARDHRGGTMNVDASQLESRRVAIFHRDIAGYDYVAGTAPGFLGFALTSIGCKNVACDIAGWSLEDPGPAEVRYDLRWD
jgi:hypothetical protein